MKDYLSVEEGVPMGQYIESADASTLKKIGINVAALVALTLCLVVAAAVVT